MSKPYFAKRLPVKADWGGSATKYVGKLFLCSRDIQVGDTITYRGKEYTVTEDSLKTARVNTETYKVIGEILTPNIKEEQEFTKKEIEYLTIGELHI
jgi:hypothetical protein